VRTAVSNIAWTAEEDDEVIDLLVRRGVDAVEIAPTRLWPDPDSVDTREAVSVAARLADKGLEVAAFQSLLFGVPDADLFATDDARARIEARLRTVIRLAGAMGARSLVYGSPATRRPPAGTSDVEAMDRAVSFFAPLAALAADHGVVVCIEPNPPQYGCAFVTTAADGAALAEAVDSPGFGLHLDAAAMVMVGDDGPASIHAHAAWIQHFHASAPQLAPLECEQVDHASLAVALGQIGFSGVVSVEMRAADGRNAPRVADSLDIVDRTYGSVRGPSPVATPLRAGARR
jgi:D-psicose/D-tagatose/L-ribulose 3-epimerase